jgi:hypothetical protein
MRLDELLRFAGLFFEEEEVAYFVFGATAMNFWVPPRNTVDLDVVVAVDKRRGASVLARLREKKIPVTRTLARMFLEGRIVKIRLGDTDLDLKRLRTDHEREALARSKVFAADDYRLRIAVPEDIILFKLQTWRRQDQADIERILKQRKDLDLSYIEAWLDPLLKESGAPMRDRWDEIRRGE